MDQIQELNPRIGGGMVHRREITIVLRDGVTGEIKATRKARNAKLLDTYNWIYTAIVNSTTHGSAVYCGLGTGENWATADDALTDEIYSNSDGSATLRTIARLSHDADAEQWSMSWSWSGTPHGFSIAQAAIFASQSSGLIWLKATFARLTKNSQDVLNIAWTQSLASA